MSHVRGPPEGVHLRLAHYSKTDAAAGRMLIVTKGNQSRSYHLTPEALGLLLCGSEVVAPLAGECHDLEAAANKGRPKSLLRKK